MKPVTAIASGLAIALVSGAVGYRLGKAGSASPAAAANDPSWRSTTAAGQRNGSAKRDLSRFAAELDQVDDPITRFSMAIDAMETWVDRHPQEAIGWLVAQPPSGRRNEVIRLAIGQWAESDPAAAASWTSENLDGVDLHNAMIRIAERWAQTDPASAARWFAALPEGNTRSAPLEGLFFAWANMDPRAARQFLDQELASDKMHPTLTRAVLAGWVKTHPAEAVTLSLETSRNTQNPALFANTIANWATVDVTASSAWLMENVPAGPERNAAVGELAGMYAHHDPDSGAKWVAKLPAKEQPIATDVLAAEWARVDPAASAAWVATLSSESVGDDALSAVVNGFQTDSPMEFDAWKEKLADGKLRARVTELSDFPEEE